MGFKPIDQKLHTVARAGVIRKVLKMQRTRGNLADRGVFSDLKRKKASAEVFVQPGLYVKVGLLTSIEPIEHVTDSAGPRGFERGIQADCRHGGNEV